MSIKKFNKKDDYERVIQFLTDCYKENNNMVCWLPERFDDLIFRTDTLYHEVVMDNYGGKTRIKEIIDFCRQMKYKKIGLAFCVGLSKEANIFIKILKNNGFEVESLICKVGSLERKIIGIEDCNVPMCNPIAQAKFLNEEKTEYNIVLGLCVGHDTLFFKYSKAPVTVLAVKDRALAHNPLGALYLADGYFKNKV